MAPSRPVASHMHLCRFFRTRDHAVVRCGGLTGAGRSASDPSPRLTWLPRCAVARCSTRRPSCSTVCSACCCCRCSRGPSPARLWRVDADGRHGRAADAAGAAGHANGHRALVLDRGGCALAAALLRPPGGVALALFLVVAALVLPWREPFARTVYGDAGRATIVPAAAGAVGRRRRGGLCHRLAARRRRMA